MVFQVFYERFWTHNKQSRSQTLKASEVLFKTKEEADEVAKSFQKAFKESEYKFFTKQVGF